MNNKRYKSCNEEVDCITHIKTCLYQVVYHLTNLHDNNPCSKHAQTKKSYLYT